MDVALDARSCVSNFLLLTAGGGQDSVITGGQFSIVITSEKGTVIGFSEVI